MKEQDLIQKHLKDKELTATEMIFLIDRLLKFKNSGLVWMKKQRKCNYCNKNRAKPYFLCDDCAVEYGLKDKY